MFTSRVEYRLILREDNADLRLRKIGHDLGLVSDAEFKNTQTKQEAIDNGIKFLRSHRVGPSQELNNFLRKSATPCLQNSVTLEHILKRPQVSLSNLMSLSELGIDIPEFALRQVEIEVKYSGFIQRQLVEVERFKNLEKIKLPLELDYGIISGLSREIKEKLNKFRPLNLGQASRISGVTPAAVSILMVYLRKI